MSSQWITHDHQPHVLRCPKLAKRFKYWVSIQVLPAPDSFASNSQMSCLAFLKVSYIFQGCFPFQALLWTECPVTFWFSELLHCWNPKSCCFSLSFEYHHDPPLHSFQPLKPAVASGFSCPLLGQSTHQVQCSLQMNPQASRKSSFSYP